MEAKYPTLRRPKRKLCYITEKKSLSNQWGEPFTYEDVDKMFDDLDVFVPEPHPPSILFQSSGSGTNYNEASISPVPQEKHPAEEIPECQISLHGQVSTTILLEDPIGHLQLHTTSSPLSNLDIDSGIPFKAHRPIKTSSPIEHNTSKKTTDELEEVGDHHGVTPTLSSSEDKAKEPQADPVPIQKAQCNGLVTEDVDWELESPPCKIVLTRVSSHKAVAQIPRDENIKESVQEVRKEPEVASSTKKSNLVSTQPPAAPSSRAKKGMTGFLKKLELVKMSKSSCSQKSPVKAQRLPPPSPEPEPEEDFMILEDDSPLWFSIPSKSVSSRTQRLSKSPSTDKASSVDKGTNDGPIEVPQKQKEAETVISQRDTRAVNQKTKKKKGKEKNPEVVGSDDNKGDSVRHQDLPAGDLIEQEKQQTKQQKKKQQKKVSVEQNEEPEEQPKDKTNVEQKEPAQKTGTKEQRSTKRKNLKEFQISSLKEKKKQPEVSGAMTEHYVFREQSQEQIIQEAADLNEFTDKDIKSKADGEAKQDKKSATSTSSSSEDAPLPRKRKKLQPGDWWVSCPQSPAKTENPQPLKKSKQNSKEPSTAVPSTFKNKKDKMPSRRNPNEPTKLSSDHTDEAKESKRKQTKRRNARDVKIEETAAKLFTAETELEEKQIPSQDQDEELSPLVFSERDHSLNSGGELFQKVYHHTSLKKKSTTSTAPESRMCQGKEQLTETEPTKRRRKPVGDWWTVPTEPDDLESINSQPQQPPLKEPRPQKKREKRPKETSSSLGSPKNSNVASKTPGGAPVTLVKPLSAPKTIKRSLPTFKHILTSVVETPTAATSGDAQQCKRRCVTSQPSEENADTGSVTCSRPDADVHSGADVDESTQPNQGSSQDRRCQTDDTLGVLRSGPSSMIELEKYDNDDTNLPSSRVQAVLSDFCASPLKPLTLHSKDEENLTEWFQSLWSTKADGGATITPDQFQWFFYQDCALGVQLDINSSSFSSGKLLMGSFMKKPLWVDHSATTIFNLLTSSVRVTVDGSVSHYRPGQAFVVECGRAYSLQNSNAQPAVLYFTRMLAESLD
ncbi:uncharacterized protein FYW61_015982 isoform 2-T2 [Anableps anableps]